MIFAWHSGQMASSQDPTSISNRPFYFRRLIAHNIITDDSYFYATNVTTVMYSWLPLRMNYRQECTNS